MIMEQLLRLASEADFLSDTAAEQFYAFGFAQYGCGNWEKATKAFSVLCARRPLEPRFWFGLGATLQEWGQYEGAMRAWAMTALLDRDDPYPHFHAAECAPSMKNEKEAQLALKEAEKRLMPSAHPLEGRISLLKRMWGGAS